MNTFLYSDPHFSHAGVCKFLAPNGIDKLRPWDNPDEMDEALVDNYNRVVRPKDKIYMLGDIAINRRGLKVLSRLNGDKVLIKGNHDIFKLHEYTPYFRDIRGFGTLDGFALTHVPIHPDSLSRWKGNLHGHLHANRVMMPHNEFLSPRIDPRYLCLSVEHINFTPISLEDARKMFEAQQ